MTTAVEERKRILSEELERIEDVIIREYAPEKIILFGSLATGNIREWTDMDLVIIKYTNKRFLDRLYDVHLMASPKIGVNFIVYTPSELEQMIEEQRWFLLEEILDKGRVLYESGVRHP